MKKSKITRNVLIAMWGIAVCLFAIIVMLSQGTFLSFLSIGITAAFGFIGFWILVPFIFIVGLSMILHKQLVKIKFGISLWGFLIIILSLLIATSHWGSIGQTVDVRRILDGFSKDPIGYPNYVNFPKAGEYFVQIASGCQYSPYAPVMGGGAVGYVLLGLLNSAITPVGMLIVCGLLFVVGILMVFNRQVVKLIKRKKGPKVKEDKQPKIEIKIDEPEFTDSHEAEVQPSSFNSPTLQEDPTTMGMMNDFKNLNFESVQGLKKPIFSLNGTIEAASITQTNDSFPSVNEPIKNETLAEESTLNVVSTSEPTSSYEETNEVVPEVKQSESVSTPVETPVVDELHRPQPKAVIRPQYVYPAVTLLDKHEQEGDSTKNNESCAKRSEEINEVLRNFNVGASIVGYTIGPSVTRYDVQLNPNVSVSLVNRYIDDISIRLGGLAIRFEPIVFGKSTSGLEIPNEIRTNVGLREAIENLPVGDKYICNIPFGKSIGGELIHANLREFPHMLVAGTTGSGKSIFMHSTIMTLIMRNSPAQLKLILIDPKKVEMTYYAKIPHLLCPNISEPRQAYVAMKKLVTEMERRYNLFASNHVRDFGSFNAFAKQNGLEPLPIICVFVDEFADLVDTCKEIKEPIVRIAQKARAAGIHLVIATQRPSVNVIDGVIKANISTHVALMVGASYDSVTIIGEGGAESLLGNGDMLVDCSLISRKQKARVQGCFVSDEEITRVCDFLRDHYNEEYDPNFLSLEEKEEEKPSNNAIPEIHVDGKEMAEEELYKQIKEDIVIRDYCSISYLTRTYAIGFPKAGRLFNKLIQDGFVAAQGDSRGNKVLIKEQSYQQNGTIEQSTFIPDEEK